ncbi:hypothetical protein KW429_11000 [Vibrio fluvialis]|nr:hypothetical protein [Vibrio fluvialis]MBY7902380.1 hypothetical protein [Vibrio fluvialis]
MEAHSFVQRLPNNSYSVYTLKQFGGHSVSSICKAHQIAVLNEDATIDDVELLDYVKPEQICQIYCHSNSIPYLYDITPFNVHPQIAVNSNLKKWCEQRNAIIAEYDGHLIVLCSNRHSIENGNAISREFFEKTNASESPPAFVMGCSKKHINLLLDRVIPNDEYTTEISGDSALGVLIKKANLQAVRSVWLKKSTSHIAFFEHEKAFTDIGEIEGANEQLIAILTEKSTSNRYQVVFEGCVYQLEIHDFKDSMMMTIHYELKDRDTATATLVHALNVPLSRYREAVIKALQDESPLILCLRKNACIHLISSEMAKTAIDFLKNNSANILINTDYYRYDDKALLPMNIHGGEAAEFSNLNPLAYLVGGCLTKEELVAIAHYIEHLTPVFAVTNCKEFMLPPELRKFAVSI